MGRFLLRTTGTIETDEATNDVQTLDFGDIGAADTFTLTHNAIATDPVTYSTDMSADITAALEGLDAFAVGDVSVSKTSLTVYVVTFAGAWAGKPVGALTITDETTFTQVGVTATTVGKSSKTVTIPLGTRFGKLMKVRWGLFENASTNDLTLTDAAGRALYTVTDDDTNVSGAKLSVIVGSDGKDQAGNAAANVLHPLCESPITAVVANDAGTVTPASGSVELYIDSGIGGRLVKRSTGTLTTDASGDVTAELSMGSTIAKVTQIRLEGFDSSTDYAITDVNGDNVFTKTGLNATTAIDFAVGYDGEDQAGNAAADSLEGVFRGPLTVTIANGGNAQTGSVTLWCEI